ncbi:hypothetical protein CpipJ_CPIJ002844 [Culex quinquefasciatus]|uniref:Uncharacterized protein n=1 Tax=Culex quinquefasciatus TaxID=7176 RepID=B0W6P1_CULQU|nr:hypothetical protein CpipJ_CPIJ002844 [Culex quinquefasciatus]|eukprot:XP_001844375.1 hypothetical protein CpipJ_CPIJ002844 [Culex quinquefasciatus]
MASRFRFRATNWTSCEFSSKCRIWVAGWLAFK